MAYGDIYDLFEPIFDWMKENYPRGGYFIVDKNSAKFCYPEVLTVYAKEINDIAHKTAENGDLNADLKADEENIEDDKNNPFMAIFGTDNCLLKSDNVVEKKEDLTSTDKNDNTPNIII